MVIADCLYDALEIAASWSLHVASVALVILADYRWQEGLCCSEALNQSLPPQPSLLNVTIGTSLLLLNIAVWRS